MLLLVTGLTWSQVLTWRMRRQHLAVRAPRKAALDVVSDIAGLHAQLMSSAELPVWVAAQAMLKPRHHVGSWLRHHGLTREPADAMLAAIPEALDGRALTREELAGEVSRITGVAGLQDKLRGGFGDRLKPAAFRGELCFAPSDGRAVRFTRPDRWVRDWAPVDADEAARAVARRYLGAYGPANREAFARWFGSPSPAQAGRWLAGLGDEAVTVEIEGEPGLMLAADAEEAAAAEPSGAVGLLPAFDHYVVAAPRDGGAVLGAAERARVYRPQGWLSPVLLVDGRMAGAQRSRGGGACGLPRRPARTHLEVSRTRCAGGAYSGP